MKYRKNFLIISIPNQRCPQISIQIRGNELAYLL